MSETTFRPLEASDVEVRVSQVNEKGCSLLLYKDARCDMRLLDEAVGADNWECEYRQIGGTLYCRVGIYSQDRNGTVWKEDCGTESNMDAKKGEASDAFKRACFKWGIGRELYTAPFIWVPNGFCDISKGKNGKLACYDRFSVASMAVENGCITELTVRNDKTGCIVFPSAPRTNTPKSGKLAPKTPQQASAGETKPPNDDGDKKRDAWHQVGKLKEQAKALGIKEEGITSWIATTYKNKDMKEFNLTEILAVKGYITTLISDKKKRDAEKEKNDVDQPSGD